VITSCTCMHCFFNTPRSSLNDRELQPLVYTAAPQQQHHSSLRSHEKLCSEQIMSLWEVTESCHGATSSTHTMHNSLHTSEVLLTPWHERIIFVNAWITPPVVSMIVSPPPEPDDRRVEKAVSVIALIPQIIVSPAPEPLPLPRRGHCRRRADLR
jgi:hypothetical protein